MLARDLPLNRRLLFKFFLYSFSLIPDCRFSDFGTSVSGGGPQRVVTESRHMQQSFSQTGQPMGPEATSPTYNQ